MNQQYIFWFFFSVLVRYDDLLYKFLENEKVVSNRLIMAEFIKKLYTGKHWSIYTFCRPGKLALAILTTRQWRRKLKWKLIVNNFHDGNQNIIFHIYHTILVNVKGRNFRKFLIALQLIMFKMNLSDIWHLKIEGYTLS